MLGRRSAFPILVGAMILLAGCARPEQPQSPAEVEISGWSWGFSYTGDYCQGRGFARNRSDVSLGNVRFDIKLLDGNDKAVATGQGRLEKATLEPGEAAPFSFFLPCPASSSAAELAATHGLDVPVTVRMKG